MSRNRVANPTDDTTRMSPPVTVGPPDAIGGRGAAAYLLVLSGSSVGEMHKVEKPRIVLGRGANADVRLLDDGISREHAQIAKDGDRIVLQDLGSTNGTYCNGERVDRQALVEGDKIRLGSITILKFSYQDRLDEMFQRQMSESALRDGLTGAYNKRYFSERIESEYGHAARHGAPLSLIFFDIDHFKQINDVHGHPAGDYVLSQLAIVTNEVIGDEDAFARYGGEEFAIIMRGSGGDAAATLAERLRAAVEAHPFLFGGATIVVTVSIGVACVPAAGVTNAGEFVARADETMYVAKRSGRNRVCVA